MPAEYGIEDPGTMPGTPGFPFCGGGCLCHGSPGPPSFCTDGANGTVAALAGSGTPSVRSLRLYATISDYLLWSDTGLRACWKLRLLKYVGPVSVGRTLVGACFKLYFLVRVIFRFASLCGVIP